MNNRISTFCRAACWSAVLLLGACATDGSLTPGESLASSSGAVATSTGVAGLVSAYDAPADASAKPASSASASKKEPSTSSTANGKAPSAATASAIAPAKAAAATPKTASAAQTGAQPGTAGSAKAPAPLPPTPAAAAAEPKAAPIQPLRASDLPPFEGEQRVLPDPAQRPAEIDLTASPDDLWQRIRRGFAMSNLDNALVRRKIAEYVAQPEYLNRMFARSRLYLYHIVEELERRSMPTELALLPMVESAFNPLAYSRAHASGLWQFIPPTGKRYSLKQTWWYDARRDIVDSTSAALDYLADLYELDGDWHLALASYNLGENAVTRAIERNRARGLPTDYSHLKLPRETRNYVPKLQALKDIISNPKAFGIELDPIPNEPYFTTITRTRDIDVQAAAKLAEMPVEDFLALNPGVNRPVIPVSVHARLVLPADKVEVFHANLERYDPKDLVSWKTYRPARGEGINSIARKFKVPVAKLKEVNGITWRNRRMPPQLVVPVDRAAVADAALPIMYSPPSLAPRHGRIHIVRRGETLYSIARRYGLSLKALQRWNGVVRTIFPGQRLNIGGGGSYRHHRRHRR